MSERQKQTITGAVHACELGLLRFLYEKGIITESEYTGIRQIAEDQAAAKKFAA